MSTQGLLEQIESHRQSRVLLLACSQLELDLLPQLYDALSDIGRCGKLDVVFFNRGGVVNAARRIALLLREFGERVNFLVPHYCESAGTIAALSADEIVAGPVAVFSPVDPLLSAANGGASGPLAMSVQDLRLFGEMARQWFGFGPEEANARAFSVLCDNVFPSTLTSFYRATLETQDICGELLALHMPDAQREALEKIAHTLIFGFHSHTYALTRHDLGALGLPMTTDPTVEQLMWSIAGRLRQTIGRGNCESADDEWCDAIIATRAGALARYRGEESASHWRNWQE